MTVGTFDRFGRGVCWLFVGVLICAVGFGPAGCQPKARTVRIQAVDLSQLMLGDQEQVALGQEDEEAFFDEEDQSLGYEALSLLRDKQDPDKEDIGLMALKLFGSPIHGGAPKKILPYTPPQRKAGGGGRKGGGRKSARRKSSRRKSSKKKGGRKKGGKKKGGKKKR